MRRFTQGSLVQPAAGHDIADPTETTDSFRLLTWRAKLLTSAVVANRFPHFQITDKSGTVLHDIAPAAAQVAGTTVVYDLCGGGGANPGGEAVVDGVSSLPLPDIWWPAGTKFNSLTTAIDVGDQWSAISWTAFIGDELEHLRWLEEIAGSIGS